MGRLTVYGGHKICHVSFCNDAFVMVKSRFVASYVRMCPHKEVNIPWNVLLFPSEHWELQFSYILAYLKGSKNERVENNFARRTPLKLFLLVILWWGNIFSDFKWIKFFFHIRRTACSQLLPTLFILSFLFQISSYRMVYVLT